MIRFFTPNENNNARFIGWWRGCQNGLTGIVGRDAASGGQKAAILPMPMRVRWCCTDTSKAV